VWKCRIRRAQQSQAVNPSRDQEASRLGQEWLWRRYELPPLQSLKQQKRAVRIKKIVQQIGIMWIRRKKTLVLVCLASVLPLGMFVYQAPRFLVYADRPLKSDAVILFVGENLAARKKEAQRLLDEGYARFLIVPAYHQAYARNGVFSHTEAYGNRDPHGPGWYPRFYEDTHIEALYAKQIMDAMGLKSAVMCSSPYHMRRIRIISRKVFGEQAYHLSYDPTPYERNPVVLWELNRADWIFVMQEYVKICWFRLYSPFIDNTVNSTSA